ncbi:hypothetical protein OH492_22160 [Vibrio chagasii]|nr:hypothetical protein [Vibrio chagasii]
MTEAGKIVPSRITGTSAKVPASTSSRYQAFSLLALLPYTDKRNR